MPTLTTEFDGVILVEALSVTTGMRGGIAVPFSATPITTSIRGLVAAFQETLTFVDGAIIGAAAIETSMDGCIADTSGWVRLTKPVDGWTLLNKPED